MSELQITKGGDDYCGPCGLRSEGGCLVELFTHDPEQQANGTNGTRYWAVRFWKGIVDLVGRNGQPATVARPSGFQGKVHHQQHGGCPVRMDLLGGRIPENGKGEVTPGEMVESADSGSGT